MISKEKLKNISTVWFVPLIALLIGITMLIRYYSSLGETIYLKSTSASGIEAGKTIIKFRDVSVGKVTKVALDKDYNNVIITAVINKDADNLLVDDARFGLVKPRIGIQGISGLNTILSGVYIEITPGTSKKFTHHYDLEDTPPLISNQAKGLKIKIYDRIGKKSINVGDPVSYKGFDVGIITSSNFSVEDRFMNYEAFIYSPYDSLVTTNTKFWITSGLDLSFGPSGLNVQAASIDSFIKGGISFGVPFNMPLGEQVPNDTIFRLYKDQQSTFKKEYKDYIEYVLLFRSSVKGLEKGASVEYLGTQIGEVVASPYDTEFILDDLDDVKIPVLIRVQKGRISIGDTVSNEQVISLFDRAIQKGLRGTLESTNLLTNNLFINLIYDPKDEVGLKEAKEYKGKRVIPTTFSGVVAIRNKVDTFIDHLNSMDLKTTSDNLNVLLKEMNTTVGNLSKLSQNLVAATNSDNKNNDSLVNNINKTLDKIQTLLDSYSENANFYAELNKAIRELNLVLKDVNGLTKQAKDKPNMFIFGNDLKDEEPTIKK